MGSEKKDSIISTKNYVKQLPDSCWITFKNLGD